MMLLYKMLGFGSLENSLKKTIFKKSLLSGWMNPVLITLPLNKNSIRLKARIKYYITGNKSRILHWY